jgi:O-antigen/teichoic acid export membrane protein
MLMKSLSVPGLWGNFRTKVVARRFVRDVSVLMAANCVKAALNFVQSILVARWLGPELYGVAALVMVYPGIMHTFFDARSSEASVKYMTQFHAAGEARKVLTMCKLGYVLDLIIASLSFLAVSVTASWAAQQIVGRPDAVGLIVISAAAFLPGALVGSSSAVLTMLGRFPLVAWIEVIIMSIRVGLVLGLVFTGWQVTGIVWGNVLATTASGLIYGIIAWVLVSRTWGASPLTASLRNLRGCRREIVRFLAYNELSALVGIIPKQLDLVLLGYFRNPLEVGYYKLARNLASLVTYLVGPLQKVAYPKLIRMLGANDTLLLRKKVRSLALHVGAPLGLTVLASVLIVPFVLVRAVGDIYAPAILAAQLLIAGSAVWLTFFWLRPLYMAQGNIRQWLKCNSVVAGLSLVAFLTIIPVWGYVGLSALQVGIQIFGHGMALTPLLRSVDVGHANQSF